MRWFKHFSDNHRGKSVQYLLDELGYFGPFFKDTLLEMCAEKLEQKSDRELTADDCTFTFHRRVVESATRAKRSTVVRALVGGQSANFWSFTEEGEYFKISAPILVDLLEYDQKKSRPRRAQIAPGSRLESEKEKSRVEKSRITKKVIPKKPSGLSDQPKADAFVANYCSLFKARWGENPVITKKDAGIAKRLSMTLSPEKHALYLDAYFSMPDAWLAKIKHPLTAFESKLNEIVVFASSGTFTTNRQANQADDFASNMILLQKVREGKA